MANPIIAAMIGDLEGTIVDVDVVQRRLDFVRGQISENNAIYADAAPQLALANRRLAETLFAAAARHAPPESSEPEPEEQKNTQQLPSLPKSAGDEPQEPAGEEEMEKLAAALAAEFAEVAARALQLLQDEGEEAVVVQLDAAVDPALAADCLEVAVCVERCRQNDRILAQARWFLLLVRAVAFAITRAHLLPGVFLAVATAYALAYAASGGAVVPGVASLLRIAALVLGFLFGVPMVGNLA
ncbi:unnamed protein product [Urochloa humidicola]